MRHLKLYWVTTEDHCEDWFIVAPSSEEACRFHQEAEGYDPGEARAEHILDIPEHVPAEVGWPSDELLLAVGGRFLSHDQPRVIEIEGRRFSEGMLESVIREIEDDLREARGEERLNKTKRSPLH